MELVAPSSKSRKANQRHASVIVVATALLVCAAVVVTRQSQPGDSMSFLASKSDDNSYDFGQAGKELNGGAGTVAAQDLGSDHVTGVVTKFIPDEDFLGDNGGVSDYGIVNDYLEDRSDHEVHRFVQDNTDVLAGTLNDGVKTKDMMKELNGDGPIDEWKPTGLEGLPRSSKDEIAEEVANDPVMNSLERLG